MDLMCFDHDTKVLHDIGEVPGTADPREVVERCLDVCTADDDKSRASNRHIEVFAKDAEADEGMVPLFEIRIRMYPEGECAECRREKFPYN